MSINVLKTQPNISCFFTRSNRILIDLHYISKLKYQLGSVKAGRPAIRTTKLADQLPYIKADVSAGLRNTQYLTAAVFDTMHYEIESNDMWKSRRRSP